MTNIKRNGKLTKIEIVRRMSLRAQRSGAYTHANSYLARRLKTDVKSMRKFIVKCKRTEGIITSFVGKNVLFHVIEKSA